MSLKTMYHAIIFIFLTELAFSFSLYFVYLIAFSKRLGSLSYEFRS